MHHSRSAADPLWFLVVRKCGDVRNMVFTQGIYVPRGDTSAVVCMYGDVLVQTAEQHIPYIWHVAGYGIAEGRGKGQQTWIRVI